MITPELVQRALRAIKRTADYEHFFHQLTSPSWIKPLWEAGLFRNPPGPEPEGEYIGFPIWAESRYLARMACEAPETVMEVMLQIPDTENVRVHEDMAEAAAAMPAKLAARLVPK